jgi:hypothetical protein
VSSETLTDGTWEPTTMVISSRRSTQTPWFTSTSRPGSPRWVTRRDAVQVRFLHSNEPSAGTRDPLSAAADEVAPRGPASVRHGDPSSSGSAR